MAAQLYSNTQLATALYEVLQELVQDGKVPEELAVQTLDQLDQSILAALKNDIQAKSEVKGNLDTYKYYDNVWQFTLSDVAFRLNATGTGSLKKVWQFTLSDVKFKLVRAATASLKKAPEVTCDKAKIVCVDVKLAPQGQD